MAVLILDQDVLYKPYLMVLYTFLGLIFSSSAAFISMIVFFHLHYVFYSLFFGTIAIALLYVFFPQILRRSLNTQNTPYGIWHTRNTLLTLSWGIL